MTSIFIEESLGQVGGLYFSGFPRPTRLLGATLTLTALPALTQIPCTLEVYVRPGFAVAAWGPGNLPPPTPTDDYLVARVLLSEDAETPLELALDSAKMDAARNAQGSAVGVPDWLGAFALHLHTRTADGTALELDVTETDLVLETDRKVFSGIDVSEVEYRGSRSRAGICAVTGDEQLRENLVWCDFHRRYEVPGQDDPDDQPEPVRSNPRLVNER